MDEEMSILEAGWNAMFQEPWDGSQAAMMGAGWDAMRNASVRADQDGSRRWAVGELMAYATDHDVTHLDWEAASILLEMVKLSVHPDDIAVDEFAEKMKAKLRWEREQRSRDGWRHMRAEALSRLLYEHLPKGDPVDVANLAMMLSMNGQAITPTR